MTDPLTTHAMFTHLAGMLEAINGKLDDLHGELMSHRRALVTVEHRLANLEGQAYNQEHDGRPRREIPLPPPGAEGPAE